MYEYERIESQLEGKLEVALQQRDELQIALEICQDRMTELMKSAANDRSKIEEAIRLVEEALQGQDEALAREASSTGKWILVVLDMVVVMLIREYSMF